MPHSTESFNAGNTEVSHHEAEPKCRNCGRLLTEDTLRNPEAYGGCCGDDCAKILFDNGALSYSLDHALTYFDEAMQGLGEKYSLTEAEIRATMETLDTSSVVVVTLALEIMEKWMMTAAQLRIEMDVLGTTDVRQVGLALSDRFAKEAQAEEVEENAGETM
ncbi:MAG: hypothetical protein RLZZ230_940 [Candidatus Parcubacteria bacterium]|jgi:hypothetical protein